MNFGQKLVDQLPVIQDFTQHGLLFTQDAFRDFFKERAQIERDYAQRLDQLCKRFGSERQRQRAAQLLWVPESKPQNTQFTCWQKLLEVTEELAHTHSQWADLIHQQQVEKLKVLVTRQEEARKKHAAFAQKLLEERNKSYADKDKAKMFYDQQCDTVEAAKNRYERAPDDRSQEKLKRAWQQEIVEMNNIKNNYILSVNAANSLKKKYFYEDLPQIENELQKLNEKRIESTKQIVLDYLNLEKQACEQQLSHMQEMQETTLKVDATADLQQFMDTQSQPWKEPYDFAFEPSLLWKDTDALMTDELSTVYLSNKLAKIQSKLESIMGEITAKGKEVDGLKNLMDAYSKNPSTGDADQVYENILDSRRAVTMLEMQKVRYESAIASIHQAIGTVNVAKRHCFIKAAFTLPTSCDFCQEKIWGLTKQGFSCKDCGYNCHAKCEMKAPLQCKQDGEKKVTAGAVPLSASSTSSTPSGSIQILTPHSASSSTHHLAGPTSSNNNSQAMKPMRALYDYAAQNPDELSLTEGAQVNLLKNEIVDEGWSVVAYNGRQGLVPTAYLSEIATANPPPGKSAKPPTGKPNSRVRVLYDYEAQNLEELSIREGDIIENVQDLGDGWSVGTLNGDSGQFPTNYCERIK